MQRKLRRQELALPENEAREILMRADYGYLATADRSGVPYAVPLNYAVDGDKLYFHCAKSGHKIDNILVNSQVGFSVTGEYQTLPAKLSAAYQSVILSGTARIVEEPALQRRALELLAAKYSPGYDCRALTSGTYSKNTAVLEMTIESITGKRGRDRPE